MRLIDVNTNKLEFFPNDRSTPPYAILSHMWTDKEVIYEDFVGDQAPSEEVDFSKIRGACEQARKDSLDYVWIDTVCIDKRSSAELAEAINSMFRWYENSSVCYVYMNDVANGAVASKSTDPETNESPANVLLKDSRWFTRGFTLQELLAPKCLVFYDCRWNIIGGFAKADAVEVNESVHSSLALGLERNRTIAEDIAGVTGISRGVLMHQDSLQSIGISTKMSWAAGRSTTRLEDQSYCLLGIFGINMPLLYGEGRNAFTRLQEEILRSSTDHTIFAWSGPEKQLFAPSPSSFAASGKIVSRIPLFALNKELNPMDYNETYEMTNSGLSITFSLVPEHYIGGEVLSLAILDCVDLNRPGYCVCLPLHGKNITPREQRGLRKSSLSKPSSTQGERIQMDFRHGHELVYLPIASTRWSKSVLSLSQTQRVLIARNYVTPSTLTTFQAQIDTAKDKGYVKYEYLPGSEWQKTPSGAPMTMISTEYPGVDWRAVHLSEQSGSGSGALLAFNIDIGAHGKPVLIHYMKRHRKAEAHVQAYQLRKDWRREQMAESSPLRDALQVVGCINISWSTKIKIELRMTPIGPAEDAWTFVVRVRQRRIRHWTGVGVVTLLLPFGFCWSLAACLSHTILPSKWHTAVVEAGTAVEDKMKKELNSNTSW